MFSIRPAEAQIALEAWTRKNRGIDDFNQPTRVTREEFKDLFFLLQAAKPLGGLGGLPFAIVSVEIGESKPDMRTEAARGRVSKSRLLTEKELGFSDNQG